MIILPGFLPLNLCSVGGAFLSICLNSLVVYLMLTRPTNLDKTTLKFSLAFSVLGMIYALCQCISQPFCFYFDGIGGSFFGSFLHDSWIPVYSQKIFMSPCWLLMLLLCTANFLYKYAATCSPRLHRLFEERWFVRVVSFIGLTYMMACLAASWSRGGASPSPEFVEKVANKLNDYYHTDFRKVYFNGMDPASKDANTPLFAILMLNFFFLMIGSTVTMLFCGWRIYSTIWHKKMSERVRKMHKKVLLLIILQALNPLLFMVFPAFVPAILMQLPITSFGIVSWIAAYSLIIYPLANPIIILTCTREYRRSFIRLLTGSPAPSSTVELSLGKPNTRMLRFDMTLLFFFAVLFLPSDAEFTNLQRVLISDALRLKCDELPYRTAYIGSRCYFAVTKEGHHSAASAECSSVFPGAQLATASLNEVFSKLMLDKSNFHVDKDSSDSAAKQSICVYATEGLDKTRSTSPRVRRSKKAAKTTCYTRMRSIRMDYPVIQSAQAESPRGCELLCTANLKCTAFAFTQKGLKSPCELLGDRHTVRPVNSVCAEPEDIYLKKEHGCQPRTDISAEFGHDPCVTKIIPSAWRGSNPICSADQRYIIRVVTENGSRITLDNNPIARMGRDGDMWMYAYDWDGLSHRVRVVAAVCAVPGSRVCPCEPLPRLPGAPALTNAPNACANPSHQVYYTHRKCSAARCSHAYNVPSACKTIVCEAGVWVFWLCEREVYTSVIASAAACPA